MYFVLSKLNTRTVIVVSIPNPSTNNKLIIASPCTSVEASPSNDEHA